MNSARGSNQRYQRVLLKLSGESFRGQEQYGLDWDIVHGIAEEIEETAQTGLEVAIVVGGGNIWRGQQAAQQGMERAAADYAGMIATVINALALQDALERRGLATRVQSAIEMQEVAEPLIRRRAIRHLEKGRVVIFAAGTGNPFFTTDTAAVLRAVEVGAEVIAKATDVDGVYDKDPHQHTDARRYEQLNYVEALSRGLKVMDATAISLSMDNNLPIIVFNINVPGNIYKALTGDVVGTLVADVDSIITSEQV